MRKRAPYVRERMYEIAQRDDESGSTSRRLVDTIKTEYPEIIDRDSEDLMDLGLMVLAGRLSSIPMQSNTNLDIFGYGKFREYMPVSHNDNGKWKTNNKRTRNVRLRDYVESKNKPVPVPREKGDGLSPESRVFEAMLKEGRPLDETFGEFLNLDG